MFQSRSELRFVPVAGKLAKSFPFLSFSLKAGQGLWVSGYFIGKKVQGDQPVQGCVFGLVHNPHAVPTELIHDAVVRDGLSNQKKLVLMVALMVGAVF